MDLWDYTLMAATDAGALFILYRAFRSERGPCRGCSRDGCAGGKKGCT